MLAVYFFCRLDWADSRRRRCRLHRFLAAPDGDTFDRATVGSWVLGLHPLQSPATAIRLTARHTRHMLHPVLYVHHCMQCIQCIQCIVYMPGIRTCGFKSYNQPFLSLYCLYWSSRAHKARYYAEQYCRTTPSYAPKTFPANAKHVDKPDVIAVLLCLTPRWTHLHLIVSSRECRTMASSS